MLARPYPPDDLTSISGLPAPDRFMPAPEVLDWIRGAYLGEGGPLHNPEHSHLADARIGVLWTSAENTRQMRRVLGEAEMPARSLARLGKWQRARAEQQLRGWFDGEVPDFLITLDALYSAGCENAAFCALVDHELYHCAQATDRFGSPRFNTLTGEPIWAMRGHDVEEFIGVVRRFGIEAAGESATELVIAAARKPDVAPAKLAQACGTCLRLAA